MQTLKFKRGDQFTLGATINIGRDDGLTGCTVAMKIKDQNNTMVLEFAPTITSAALGTVEYRFAADEMGTAGVYWVEFWITDPDGVVRKAPSEDWCNIVILDDII